MNYSVKNIPFLKNQKFGVFDFETTKIEVTKKQKFLLGGVYSYDNLLISDKIEDIIAYMIKSDIKIFYAHNLMYDFRFLFEYIKNFEFEIKPLSSNLLCVIVKKRGVILFEIRDSYALMVMPLKKATKSYCKYYHKQELNLNEINFNKNNKNHREYLHYDIFGLYEALTNFFQFLNISNFPLTISLCAIRKWREIEKKQKLIKDNGCKEKFFRESYYGGRVENFQLFSKNAYYFDVNSEYPYVMKKQKYPIGISKKIKSNFKISDYEYFIVKCNVEIPKNIYISPLPYRYKGLLTFPVGKIKNVYLNSIDINSILNMGGKVEIIKGFYWENSINLFSKYVDYYYDKKMNAKNQGEYQTAKRMLNALSGKFGQKQEKIFFVNDDEYSYKYFLSNLCEVNDTNLNNILSVNKNNIPQYSTVQIISFITSYARQHLFNFLNEVLKKDHNLYYCDTDSVITDYPFKHHKNNLGALNKEYDIEYGYYIAPKLYGFRTIEGEDVIRCKGLNYNDVNLNKLKKMMNKNYSLKSSMIQISKIKSIMKGFKEITECYKNTKYVKRQENKRTLKGNKLYPLIFS